jgi:glycosyltransferase involved in cell wall biosynthesis
VTPDAPLVSCILLTTHPKRAAFVPDALRSFRAQTHPGCELVVVNDGPVPLVARAPDVQVVNLPARDRRWTLGEKRNAGVRLARGRWVATWDDDDISLPGRIAAQIEAAERLGAQYVLGDRTHVADADMSVQGSCFRGASLPVMSTALIERAAIVAAGGYPVKDYMEDAELLERIRLLVRARVEVIPADWYVMRRHGDNVTLAFGESTDGWVQCALRDPRREAAQAAVDAIRRGPGAEILSDA